MHDTTTKVRTGYDRWATVYDHDANPLLALEEPVMHEAVGNPTNLSALDLGCGTGRHSLWLAAHGAEVTALDFSEGMLQQAHQKPGAEAIQFLMHDLHNPLPFKNAAFDLILSGLVLEHIQKLEPFFAEVRRVLKPAGRAVISAMHPAMFLRGSQARFTDPQSGEIIQPGSIPHSVSDFMLAALRTGFEIATAIELAPNADFAKNFPRAEKYIGWPMLVVLSLAAPVN